MVSSVNRFHGTNSLNYAYRHGQTLRSKYFTVKHVINSRRDVYRVAVVVSKKVSKSAPVRNHIRRRIYELVRVELAKKLVNHDIVISVFDDSITKLTADELKKVFIYTTKELVGK